MLSEANHPFSLVTKSSLVERDIDLIAPMAAKRLASIYVSITTLDRQVARRLELGLLSLSAGLKHYVNSVKQAFLPA